MSELTIDPEVAKLGEEMLRVEQGLATPHLTALGEQYKELAGRQAKLKTEAKALGRQMENIKADLFNALQGAGLQNWRFADGALAYVQKQARFGLVDPSYRHEALDWLLETGAAYELNPTQTVLTRVCAEREALGEALPEWIEKHETEFVVIKGGV